MAEPGKSLIYRSLPLYRLSMNLLYLGGHKNRFRTLADALPTNARSVLELCFGDIILAGLLKERGVAWTGLDTNPGFVANAKKHLFDARLENILDSGPLPSADCCVMAGSLYHFHGQAEGLLKKMVECAPVVLLSEPVKNLSAAQGPLGWLARRMTNAGAGPVNFRYNTESLTALMVKSAVDSGFKYTVLSLERDVLIRIERETT